MQGSTGRDRFVVVLGTRPEVIKLARVIDLLGDDAVVVHTGQHYDPALASGVFAESGLRPPDIQLHVGGTRRGAQIAAALGALDEIFAAHAPAAVVVQGDTNATVAGALAANAAGIPLVHVEAGLRSFDRAMPEEHNRVVTDHLATVLCAATEQNAQNLAREGLCDGVVVTGNTVVEAVAMLQPEPDVRRKTIAAFGLTPGGYLLSTIHRPENTDDPARLRAILEALARADRPTLVALHPRTRQAAERHGLRGLLGRLQVVDPLSSADFLSLAEGACLLVSDSGGVQEECTVLKRRLLVVRNSTERPESLDTFARLVVPRQLAAAIDVELAAPDGTSHLADVPSPYGDGRASERVVALLQQIRAGSA